MADQYHLWRSFKTTPFFRWAFTLTPDEGVPDLFRITDYDPQVGDAAFMHTFRHHFSGPQLTRTAIEGDSESDHMTWVHPGDPGHFDSAVRSFRDGYLGATGRAA